MFQTFSLEIETENIIQFSVIMSKLYSIIYSQVLLFLILIIIIVLSIDSVNSQSLNHAQVEEQSTLLKLKKEWKNPASIDSWNPSTLPPHCNWTGIICDDKDFVTGIKLIDMNITEKIPTSICDLKKLTEINLSGNDITGEFPTTLYNCSKLQILDLSRNYFQGPIPDDINRISSLRELNLGWNSFSGDIPVSIGSFQFLQSLRLYQNLFHGSFPVEIANLTNLEILDLDDNMFSPSRIPSEFGKLKNLKQLWMTRTNLIGQIPETISDLIYLERLDLSHNNLNGTISKNLFLLWNLNYVTLKDNKLSGEIPREIKSLDLIVIDLSNNMLTGTIPVRFGVCQYLSILHMYFNRLTGEIPRDIGQMRSLTDLRLYKNNLTGALPPSLGSYSKLNNLDVSENQLTGYLPQNLCAGGGVRILIVVSSNKLSGILSTTFEDCTNLEYFDMSNNRFFGSIPENIWRNASNNRLTGKIPVELTALSRLQTLALDGNQLSDDIPPKIISWRSLTTLTVSRNQISGELPLGICLLPVLSVLDLSENQISGQLPSEIVKLRLRFLNLSSNKLTGKLPAEFEKPEYERSFLNNSDLVVRKSSKLSPKLLVVIVVIAGATFLASVLLILLVNKGFCKRKPEQDLAITWDMTAFQELHFTESNILSNLTEDNQIGSGGSGKVYRVAIDHLGHFVAVKKIWSERKLDQKMEKQFQAEVQILGTIRHINIVKLLCCISNKVSKLLVYEYMENGSLYEWLHENNRNLSNSNNERFLDWPKRLQIAVGVAQGLSYMHHNCSPPIIHRDMKSSNILLDSDFKARIADFGLARTLIKQDEPNTASVIAGSFGYIAPEYAHTKKVNEKIDVYSFGVVLLELVTGKEANKGDEYRNLAEWAWSRFHEVDSVDVLMDEGVKEECYLEEMRMVFKLGMICTHTLPSSRPSMKDALQILLWHAPAHQALSASSPGIQIVERVES